MSAIPSETDFKAVIAQPAVHESTNTAPAPVEKPGARLSVGRRVGRWVLRFTALIIAFGILGSSAYSWNAIVNIHLNQPIAGHRFKLLNWEVGALSEKAAALWRTPAADLSAQQGSDLVRSYLQDARLLVQLDDKMLALMALGTRAAEEQIGPISRKADSLRTQQEVRRPAAEAVIQAQITQVLQDAGFGVGGRLWPPVLFTFTEAPKQLVVSPRTRILSGYARTLDPAMNLAASLEVESEVEQDGVFSAYVTETGGMGAFPTMVVPDAKVPWVLSTVAHEWVHTYLAFFPLGFNYGVTAENRIINETTADIVGNEIGKLALARFYPELIPPSRRDDVPAGAPSIDDGGSFDFRAAMAETRAVTDKLLHFGRVADAEQYMELRRQLFVENGYLLRKLNQAWFAFHGSYGTGAAADVSTPDALAPRVVKLRTETGSPHAFLQAVRRITDAAGLDKLLENFAQPRSG